MKALLATGTGRYADPWHPYPETSVQLAGILRDAGFEVEDDADPDRAIARLDAVDLLVVNAGDPWRGNVDGDDGADGGASPDGLRAALDGLRAALDRGIGVLALHAAVSSLRDYPEWAAAIGAVWLPGVSYHPPLSRTRIDVAEVPGLTTATSFEVEDERYCRLQPIGARAVVAWHAGDGAPEPAAWIAERGAARIAVDVLGHDARSYESEGHRALVAQLARWAAAPR